MVILTLWSSYFIVKGSWRWHLPRRYHRMCLLVPLGMTSAACNTSVYRTIHLLLETCCFVYADLHLFTSFMMTDYCMQSYWHSAVFIRTWCDVTLGQMNIENQTTSYNNTKHLTTVTAYWFIWDQWGIQNWVKTCSSSRTTITELKTATLKKDLKIVAKFLPPSGRDCYCTAKQAESSQYNLKTS